MRSNVRNEKDSIYVLLRKKGAECIGHMIRFEFPDDEYLSNAFQNDFDKVDTQEEDNRRIDSKTFFDVIRSFEATIATYRKSIALTIELSPLISQKIAENQVTEFAMERGRKLEDSSTDSVEVYELPFECVSTLLRRHDSTTAALKGAAHLPKIGVIGLISAYDAYLSDLLRAIFTEKPELIFTSEKEIKFSDLRKFKSIEDAKEHILDSEVETVLRKSHHEQFSWMASKFSMRLKEGLDVWPNFVELCERRNLLTHTGGVVSQQYINNCLDHKVPVSASVGDFLDVDLEYFKNSIEVVAEIGMKLGHVMWRKFRPSELAKADSSLNELGMRLIADYDYATAARILEFGVGCKKHSNDRLRRMMVVNLANAYKLENDQMLANKILDKEDWTAVSPEFQICVEAVRGNTEVLCKMMKQAGSNGPVSSSDFKDWPVFRGVIDDKGFIDTYEEIFGHKPIPSDRRLEHKEF